LGNFLPWHKDSSQAFVEKKNIFGSVCLSLWIEINEKTEEFLEVNKVSQILG
jgi:hypothetical protein